MSEPRRFARIDTGTEESWAELRGEQALLLDAAPWAGGCATGESLPAGEARLVCPVAPQKIFGIGRNYRAHAEEMGGKVPAEPLVFMKATSSLVGPGGTIVLPKESSRVDYEGELGVVIGKRCRRVPVEQALSAVFGYTAVCDVTARDFQDKDGQWSRAKGYDTFCPTGPVVVSGLDPASLHVSLSVNGVRRQHASVRQMVFDVARLVSHVSSFATLEPGDLIATGTPEGVGPLGHGDTVDVTIDHVGTLRLHVVRES
jgi:2-keto-4-pentenoate hydratase/2-oxohepta-3-ene-1,7-dioic acid hydratase in catechol pathway